MKPQTLYIGGGIVVIGGLILLSRGKKSAPTPELVPVAEPIHTPTPPPNTPTAASYVPQDAPRKKAPMLRAPPKRGDSTSVQEVLRLTNVERQKVGLSALQWSDVLARSALGHARDMGDKQYFDHIGLDGSTPDARIRAAGYTGMSTGENIASGQPNAREVMVAWMNSPGHRANILRREFKFLGVGYYYTASGEYHHYWVQNFGG